MNGNGDIIIKGGSIDLIFDSNVYLQNPGYPQSHMNHNLRITRIVIGGDVSFDSGEHPEGITCIVTVFTR